jgi:autotransporter strand-loop-strand O-heptosyltransferase
MKEVLINEYGNLNQLNIPAKKGSNTFKINFLNGAFVEILGPDKKEYTVRFIDQIKNKLIHSQKISTNMWTKTNIQYFVKWRIEVIDNETNKIAFEHDYDAKGKRVYIHLDSSALGDTLAWFPYIDEFRKKHNCETITSTFHNEWFNTEYPELEFVKPGTEVQNIYAMYTIGWHYNEDRTVNYNKIPIEFKKHPLGETSSSTLGLTYSEIKPKMVIPEKARQIEGKYVCIAPHASAHAKYWNNKGGWQSVVDYLNNKGYKVVMITHERLGDAWHDSKLGGTLHGVIDKTGNYPIEDRMIDLKYADAFIGLGSGLSWLSWAVGTPTILISGFSLPYSEFLDCERIFNYDSNVCTGCFNREWLNPGDWEWCPDHKNTDRQFECTKTIKASRVIESINKVLNIYNEK